MSLFRFQLVTSTLIANQSLSSFQCPTHLKRRVVWFRFDACRAAEQLVVIEKNPLDDATPNAGVSDVSIPMIMEDDELAESGVYRFAKSLFHLRRYRRAAYFLRDQIDRKSLFLRSYALYLVSFLLKQYCDHMLVLFRVRSAKSKIAVSIFQVSNCLASLAQQLSFF